MTLVEARNATLDLELEEASQMEVILGSVQACRRNVDWDLIPEQAEISLTDKRIWSTGGLLGRATSKMEVALH
jgi:hypothetical protein